jgi:hypothetical protein
MSTVSEAVAKYEDEHRFARELILPEEDTDGFDPPTDRSETRQEFLDAPSRTSSGHLLLVVNPV